MAEVISLSLRMAHQPRSPSVLLSFLFSRTPNPAHFERAPWAAVLVGHSKSSVGAAPGRTLLRNGTRYRPAAPRTGPEGPQQGRGGLSPHSASLSPPRQVCISNLTKGAVLISSADSLTLREGGHA